MANDVSRVPREIWARVVAQAWADESFRQRLLAEPQQVLGEYGFSAAETVKFDIHENTDSDMHFFLPAADAGIAATLEKNKEGGAVPVQALLAEALANDNLKQHLLADPNAVLDAKGLQPPEGIRIHVWEDTPTLQHLVLPKTPETSELSDEELETVTGGRRSSNTEYTGYGATL
ncbi:MAG: NHLP leader peptide family natural product precursor [Gammaproteobacteria bacterium]|nr:NHLP leader peptide family natural product precursor [Gammaproteobacteria bacterium]